MSKPRSILDRSFRYRPSFATDILPLHPLKKTG